jgi:hypothetical protein
MYDTVAAEIVTSATNQVEQNGPQDIPLQDEAVRDIAKRVITGERIQGYGEQIVDGTYNWLEGQTKTPDFAVDLTSVKQELGTAVADAGVQQAQGLPVCTAEQLQQIDINNLDLFSLQCLPPGVDLGLEQQKLLAKTVVSQEILKDPTISANDPAAPKGEKPFQKLSYLPTIFQWSKVLPWILGLGAIVSGTGVVFLYTDRIQGLKKVAKKLLISGAMLVFIAGLLALLFSRVRPDPEVVKMIELRDSILIVVTSLGSAVNRVLIIFAATYAVIGGGGLIGLHFVKPKAAAVGAAPVSRSTK